MMSHPFSVSSRSSICHLLLLGTLGLGACDRGDGRSARTTQCARFCDALEKCDDVTDLLDCRDQCTSDEVRSDAYFRARADCGEELSCNRWVSEVDSQGVDVCEGDECKLTGCVDRKLAKLTLNEEQKQVCSSVSTKLNACDPALEPDDLQRDCEHISPLLSQTYVDSSQRCTELVCDRIQSCLDDLADEYETDLRLYSGKLAPR